MWRRPRPAPPWPRGTLAIPLSLALLVALAVEDVNCEGERLRRVEVVVPEAVRAGTSATLRCEYEPSETPLYAVRWYLSGQEFYRWVPGDTPVARLFPLQVELQVDLERSGARAVHLTRLQRAHSGEYRCEVTGDAPLFHTAIRAANMSVVEVPREGPSLRADTLNATLVSATCLGPPAFHRLHLTWWLDGEALSSSGRRYVSVRRELSRPEFGEAVHSTQLHLQLPLDRQLLAAGRLRLRCLATLHTLYRRSAQLDLLLLPPHVAMVITTSSAASTASLALSLLLTLAL